MQGCFETASRASTFLRSVGQAAEKSDLRDTLAIFALWKNHSKNGQKAPVLARFSPRGWHLEEPSVRLTLTENTHPLPCIVQTRKNIVGEARFLHDRPGEFRVRGKICNSKRLAAGDTNAGAFCKKGFNSIFVPTEKGSGVRP